MADSDPRAQLQRTFLDRVRDRVRREQYQRWFSGLRVLSTDGTTVVLGAPNDFVVEWLEGYYLDVLEESARETVGPEFAVRIVADERPEPAPTRRREAPARRTPPARESRPAPRTRERRRAPPSRGPARGTDSRRSAGFSPSGSDLFGHTRYRNLLSDVILNDDYIFENFVEGPSNQLAHAAAGAVSNSPGAAYNPLFLHGAVGLGKTHLLQAICTRYLQANPEAKVIYLSCESFVNQFIAAVAEGQIQDFRYRYRHVDMLLIDDIHFLAKKERTQEEFFHTFNTLYNSKKQIILSCDSPPAEIPTLEDRLVSRFKWGLVAEIEAPDHETRVSIVRKKAERRSLSLPDDVALYIADHITANVRELEGAVLRVCSYSSLSGKPITIDLAHDALRDLVRPSQRKVSIETILRVAAEHFGVKVSDLTGKRRQKTISHPRQVAMYLARRLTEYSLVEIGGQFGGRDHTTVIYANDKIADQVERDDRLREDLEMLTRKIRSGA
jgi:chromosomal replication initiator protein